MCTKMRNVHLMHPLTNQPVPDPITGQPIPMSKTGNVKFVIINSMAKLIGGENYIQYCRTLE